jgi:predicted nucleic acid-binding protein
MIVLDTNVLSETLRLRPANSVKRWMEIQSATSLFTTSICQAEILYGVGLLAPGRRRTALENAIAAIFDEEFAGRVLGFDSAAARAFAEIAVRRRRLGRPISEFDAQIAAIALANGATVATRNIEDFIDCGITVVSPWKE